MMIFAGGVLSVISMRPMPTLLLPSHAYSALAAGRTTVTAFQIGIDLFLWRPRRPLAEVLDERKHFLRQCLADKESAQHWLTALGFMYISSQMWPSRSWKPCAYMKPWSCGSL